MKILRTLFLAILFTCGPAQLLARSTSTSVTQSECDDRFHFSVRMSNMDKKLLNATFAEVAETEVHPRFSGYWVINDDHDITYKLNTRRRKLVIVYEGKNECTIERARRKADVMREGLVATLPPPFVNSEDPDWLWTVAFHPTEPILATGGTDGMLRFARDGMPEDSILIGGTITELDWHPAGRLLAVATQGEGTHTYIYDRESGTLTQLDGVDETGARGIGWNKAGDRLAVGDYSGNLSVYDRAGDLLGQYHLEQKGIIGLDWSPDGRTIAAIGDDLVLFDLGTKSYRTIPDREEEVLMLSVAFHPSGELIATGDYGRYDIDVPPLLQYWTPEGERLQRIEKEVSGEYRSLEWSHDGSRLATVSDSLRLYDRSGEKTDARGKIDMGLLWGASWSPDDRTIAVTDDSENGYWLTEDLTH